ncbi:MAG: fumarylacetoacetate hydrolase family protein [bacterium]
MVTFVIPTPAQPSLPTSSGGRFPVRRIFCVGRNYADHAREMGHDPNAEPPFYFTKPGDAVVESGATIPYPPQTADLHHEAELVVALASGGTAIAEADALSHVWGYATGNDLTRRDLQAAAKAARRPWDMAKGFDASAVVGLLHPGPLNLSAAISCSVDGKVKQASQLSEMIWPVPAIIAHLSRLVTLAPGDLIFTGTPAGVGPLQKGQTCVVKIDGLSPAIITIG